METRQVIRIEHSDGYGIFRKDIHKVYRPHSCLNPESNLLKLSNRHDSFNCPIEDKLNLTHEHFCAYKSLPQMLNYILIEEIFKLIELDYNIYILQLSDYLEGEDNILFKKEDIISKQDITLLFI